MSTATTDHPPPQEPAAARLQNMATPPPRPSELEHLPCPRCDSTNTKFCYYNNYNLSQPRHFCKSCRRYWTRGGTLRNVPVGGGSRKSSATNKRPRSTPSASTPTATAAATSSSSSSSSTLTSTDLAPPKSVVVKAENGYGTSLWGGAVNLNEVAVGDLGSLLRAQQQQGGGFVSMANFGFGFGLGLGSGFGTWDWPTEQVEGEVDAGGGEENVSGGAATGCNTWQLACVESGLPEVEGDCYGLPDLAISAPGQSLFK